MEDLGQLHRRGDPRTERASAMAAREEDDLGEESVDMERGSRHIFGEL